MRTIHLYDSLKELAGVDTLQLDVDTPNELFSGLYSQVPGFQKHVRDKQLAVLLMNEDQSEYEYVSYANFQARLGRLEHVHLVPETAGSGIETAIIAAVGATGVAAAAITIAVNLAISFIASAIVKALAPSPSGNKGSIAAASNPSFIFNGAELVYEQGYPIPLIYGIHTTGGIVIYTDVSVEDIPFVPAQITTNPTTIGLGTSVDPLSYQWGYDQP